MHRFNEKLNSVLVELYVNISRLEEQTLKNAGRIDLSINEMHMIEIIGKAADEGKTIGDIADDMDIKSPSATVAVNKLVRKGYLEKRQSKKDGRAVYVRLTQEGRSVKAYHSYYHRLMIRQLSDDLDSQEKEILLKAIEKLNIYLKGSIEKCSNETE